MYFETKFQISVFALISWFAQNESGEGQSWPPLIILISSTVTHPSPFIQEYFSTWLPSEMFKSVNYINTGSRSVLLTVAK